MKPDPDAHAAPEAAPLSVLALDADPALAREPRLLVDPRFLGILHFELAQKLGAEQAACNLLQLGFLRGLRDAMDLVAQGLRGDPAPGRLPTAPLLAMRFQRSGGRTDPDIALQGSWPDHPEAEAWLSTLGPSHHPVCWASTGYTSGWLSGIHEIDVLAVETRCVACGETTCRFVARTPDAWRALGDPRARELLRFLPFAELRSVVEGEIASEGVEDTLSLGNESAVVHVWGPVMILPFSGPDESMKAVELIGSDPEAREVSVVIVDLEGVILDDAFGALALERVLDGIEGWVAEPILTGISPLSEPVVRDLERSHVVIHKDLPEAISAAFQIVQVQRNPL